VPSSNEPPAFQEVAKGKLCAPWNQADFAFNLLRQLKKEKPQQNVFISPVGLALSLLLLREGARGKTRSEIDQCLGVKNSNPEELKHAVAGLIRELRVVNGLELVLGNSIWVQQELDLISEFEANARKYFDAEVEKVDFASEKTRERMNKWVRRKTGGKIDAVTGGSCQNTLTSILNTAYFKGAWLARFDPNDTAPGIFTRSDKTQETVPMMFKKSYFNSVMEAGWKGVSLPYRGNRFHMLVILPDESLDEFIDRLNPAYWASCKTRFLGTEVVKMPRFKVAFEAALRNSLGEMGLGTAFCTEAADFSGIVRPPVRVPVGDVLCRTICEVDEFGTTAAAVANLKLYGGGGEMVVNHPFLFVIEEIETKCTLFLGAVEDPEQLA